MTPPITAPARADSAEIKLAFIVSKLSSLLASWVPNQRQVRSQWIAHDKSRRVQRLIDNGGDEDVRNQVRPHGAGSQE